MPEEPPPNPNAANEAPPPNQPPPSPPNPNLPPNPPPAPQPAQQIAPQVVIAPANETWLAKNWTVIVGPIVTLLLAITTALITTLWTVQHSIAVLQEQAKGQKDLLQEQIKNQQSQFSTQIVAEGNILENEANRQRDEIKALRDRATTIEVNHANLTANSNADGRKLETLAGQHAVELASLRAETTVQGKTVQAVAQMNNGFGVDIANLKGQIEKLNEELAKARERIASLEAAGKKPQ